MIVCLGLLSVYGQDSDYLSQLPGYQQWQSNLATHAHYEEAVRQQIDVQDIIEKEPDEPADTKNQNDNNFNSILERSVNEKEGLKEILKQVIKNRISFQSESQRKDNFDQDITNDIYELNENSSFLDKLSSIFLLSKSDIDKTFQDQIIRAEDKSSLIRLKEEERNEYGRFIPAKDLDSEKFFDVKDSEQLKENDFVTQELEEAKDETKEIIKELENLIEIVEGRRNFILT